MYSRYFNSNSQESEVLELWVCFLVVCCGVCFFFLKQLLLLMDGFLSIFRQQLHRQHVRALLQKKLWDCWGGIEGGEMGGPC